MPFDVRLLKIPVRNLPTSIAFYEQVLGLPASFVAEPYGWAHFSLANFELALYVPGLGGGNRGPGGSVDFHLCHDDIDALYEVARQRSEDAVLHANDDGSHSLEFPDPDGNLLKIVACTQGTT